MEIIKMKQRLTNICFLIERIMPLFHFWRQRLGRLCLLIENGLSLSPKKIIGGWIDCEMSFNCWEIVQLPII